MSERKFVKPARIGAAIPDPDRGRDLPGEGIEVDWTPYWASMAERGEIIINDSESDKPAQDARPITEPKKIKS